MALPKGRFAARLTLTIAALVSAFVLTSCAGSTADENASTKSPQSTATEVPTMFFELDANQSGKEIETSFAVKTSAGTGFDSIAAAGKLQLTFKWSGQGVPPKKTAKIEVNVTPSDYDCSVYCKATITKTVPKAYTGASWLDVVATFTPKGSKKGFVKKARVLVIE